MFLVWSLILLSKQYNHLNLVVNWANIKQSLLIVVITPSYKFWKLLGIKALDSFIDDIGSANISNHNCIHIDILA